MPEVLESEWIQELEENEHTDEEPPERDIEAVRASLRSLVHRYIDFLVVRMRLSVWV